MSDSENCRLIGVIHLLPLPGTPGGGTPLAEVAARAVADARALAQGGAHGVILENFGDAPFAADEVRPYVVAAMTRIALAVREAAPSLELGINVLRNDAMSALSIAGAVDAAFIRVNVHSGAMLTDQGLIQGKARDTLLERDRLGCSAYVAADIMVKHAVPIGNPRLEDLARDTHYRGKAGALILTGAGTGLPTSLEDVATVRAAVPQVPIWIGSGLTPERAAAASSVIQAGIVGTWLHEEADLRRPVDPRRVETMRTALGG